jgi:antibiotic biosynthesis monooxygenase (ABM) superfamily enzyme
MVGNQQRFSQALRPQHLPIWRSSAAVALSFYPLRDPLSMVKMTFSAFPHWFVCYKF